MKRVFLCFLCFLLSFVGCGRKSASASSNLKNLPPPNYRNLLVLGDSIAAGYGLENEEQNYTHIFAKEIGANLQNVAVNGYDSFDLLEQLNAEEIIAAIKDANIILLSIGGNDLLHQSKRAAEDIKSAVEGENTAFSVEIEKVYENFQNNLKAYLSSLKAINPNCIILVQNVYNPIGKQNIHFFLFDAGKFAGRYIDRLNTSIESVCKEMDSVYVLDVATELNKSVDNFYNWENKIDIHPTIKGHSVLAKIITKEFNALLNA